tara:strand:+ start:19 stop:369 length:351 start_codon:yes stop_codon:yes gene_type:complete
MAKKYAKITGNSAQILVARQKVANTTTKGFTRTFSGKTIVGMSLCNIHATDSVDVDLFIYDAANTTEIARILHNKTIEAGTTLFLEGHEVSFNNGKDYDLRIQLSAADSAVDVIIR